MANNLSLHVGLILEKYLVDVWEDRIMDHIGIHYLFHFPNQYGASVVKVYGSTGYDNDRWELCPVLFHVDTDDDLSVLNPDTEYTLVYPTDICRDNNPLGNLTDKQVRTLLRQIKKLE